jgi:hypothetical protein
MTGYDFDVYDTPRKNTPRQNNSEAIVSFKCEAIADPSFILHEPYRFLL